MSEFARTRIADELERFFMSHNAQKVESAVRRAAENIRVNSKQADRDWSAIAKYLHEQYPI